MFSYQYKSFKMMKSHFKPNRTNNNIQIDLSLGYLIIQFNNHLNQCIYFCQKKKNI